MYEELAKYYDNFMDAPYERWIDFVARILADRKTGVDIGCGTGKFTIGLSKRGYTVTGADPSPEMLSIAVESAKKQGVSVPFVMQSAEKFTSPKPLDFITACCDVVNYLKTPKSFFERAYKSLNKGGMLIFDISSEYKLRNILGNNTFTDSTEEVTYIWENSLSKNKVDMTLTFFALQPNNYYARSVDEQTQYIHAEEELTKALKEVGFSEVKTYGFLKTFAPKQNEERIHFVAVKGE